ncbi:MAG TPA: MGMT family protein [Candidatus Paceibacterota bacterium]|nr:MGMT family protein [Candidatus Paceibacterota bacterium]
MTSFRESVLSVVRSIPRGRTMTYGEVAARAGRPRAHRAVAGIMSRNVDPTVPCHRVVGADGSMRGYNVFSRPRETLAHDVVEFLERLPYTRGRGGDAESVKRALLEAEGVIFS